MVKKLDSVKALSRAYSIQRGVINPKFVAAEAALKKLGVTANQLVKNKNKKKKK